MALTRFSLIRRFSGASQRLLLPSISRCSPSFMNSGMEGFGRRSIMNSSCDISGILGWNSRDSIMICSMKVSELMVYSNGTRSMSTMKVPAGARQVALKVTMLSPGFVYEPYKPREPIPFWKRWFTPSGWRRTKEDIILEMKNAYAISRLRKVTGYSKKLFYQDAIRLYKEINTLISDGNTSSLRKVVTGKMYSTLKNELKRRESMWSSVYWELVEPVVSIRTLRARMIALDKNDLDKAFIQLTIEFVTKQKFESYDSKGAVVSGDKTKEVLVKDIWVFERSLFHPGADWRLCARLAA
ncbi:Tim44-like domain containing protein [Cocos nucifera]|uniref:Large ribosomal subunit protein mL45 n=1 Tax=Cocos nucifera TaxID=13894 RepID=A0A8K0HW86_COCNU|nr:Tim44-like domain containing protein [Cocos nucifera]